MPERSSAERLKEIEELAREIREVIRVMRQDYPGNTPPMVEPPGWIMCDDAPKE